MDYVLFDENSRVYIIILSGTGCVFMLYQISLRQIHGYLLVLSIGVYPLDNPNLTSKVRNSLVTFLYGIVLAYNIRS